MTTSKLIVLNATQLAKVVNPLILINVKHANFMNNFVKFFKILQMPVNVQILFLILIYKTMMQFAKSAIIVATNVQVTQTNTALNVIKT